MAHLLSLQVLSVPGGQYHKDVCEAHKKYKIKNDCLERHTFSASSVELSKRSFALYRHKPLEIDSIIYTQAEKGNNSETDDH
jgi:hypothetical protein